MKELVKKGLKILVIFTKGNEKDRYTRTSIYIPSNKLEWQCVLQLQQKKHGYIFDIYVRGRAFIDNS